MKEQSRFTFNGMSSRKRIYLRIYLVVLILCSLTFLPDGSTNNGSHIGHSRTQVSHSQANSATKPIPQTLLFPAFLSNSDPGAPVWLAQAESEGDAEEAEDEKKDNPPSNFPDLFRQIAEKARKKREEKEKQAEQEAQEQAETEEAESEEEPEDEEQAQPGLPFFPITTDETMEPETGSPFNMPGQKPTDAEKPEKPVVPGKCESQVSPRGIAFHNCPLNEVINEFEQLTGEKYVIGLDKDFLDPQTPVNYEYKLFRELEKGDYKDIFLDFLKKPTKDDLFKLAIFVNKDGEKVIRQAYELNTDKMSLPQIIDQLAEYLEINYILDPQAAVGKDITLVTHKNVYLTREQIWNVLYTILEINGLALLEKGEFFKIYPITEAKEKPLDFDVPTEYLDEINKADRFESLEDIQERDKVVMQIVPLSFIGASEMSNYIRPFMTKAATITPHQETNMLIITEVLSNLKKVLKLIELIDVDTSLGDFEVFQVIYADASEVANVIKTIISSKAGAIYAGARGRTARGRTAYRGRRAGGATTVTSTSGGAQAVIHADQRSNSIIMFASRRDIEFARELLGILDQDIYGTLKTFIYYCENAKAEDLASLLNSVYGKSARKSEGKAPSSTKERWSRRFGEDATRRRTQPKSEPKTSSAPGAVVAAEGGAIVGDLTIVPDERTNSLIIVTSEDNYRKILALLKEIDSVPKQVLIEILYAEIKLSEEMRFGVNWSALNQGQLTIGGKTYGFDATVSQDVMGGKAEGLNFNIFEATRFSALINILSRDNVLRVLSNPHVLASNNIDAKIEIGDRIPVVTSEVEDFQTGVQSSSVRREVQYRDTGIILNITPHINENRYVTLEIQQEISEVSGSGSNPPIQNRSLETTVMVKDGMSLVLGGLIKTTSNPDKVGIPGLSKIPILGHAFSQTSYSKISTELLMVITPHVIASPQEAALYSDSMWERHPNIIDYYRRNKERFY